MSWLTISQALQIYKYQRNHRQIQMKEVKMNIKQHKTFLKI